MNVDLSSIDPALLELAQRIDRRIRAGGGRVYLVGGSVRDALLGRPVKDLDLEVFGLEPARLRSLLEEEWRLDQVGESFAVLKLRHHPIDISLPRRERKTGAGHRDFEIAADPHLSIPEAARRRDFTINSMLIDLETRTLEDPFEGRRDLERRVLRHTSERFTEDPLRVLRGMQLAARFDLHPHPATVALSSAVPFEGLARERVFEEWRKLVLQGREISRGLRFLSDTGWISRFPELQALIGCPQDPEWHPEGDVWTHTLHVMDAFAAERLGDDWEDVVVGFACLCHDFGKPATTVVEGGRVRSLGHEAAGEPPTRSFLARLTNQTALHDEVVPLVRHHLKPRQLHDANASDAAVRRLANKVGRIDRLARVARADAGGRPPLPADDDAAGRWLLARAEALTLSDHRPTPLVLGRHLLARGLTPGPHFGPILDRCFEAQLDGEFSTLEQGLAFLDRLLDGGGGPAAGGEPPSAEPQDAEPGAPRCGAPAEIKARSGSS
ncbi:MAG TPA: polynucleotide adenylyltransferase [Thermoanaerobaculia bacterium]|nr:polynucleotide adenylyltransferase [Thermoanaerobaculia bacterium]